MSEPIERLRRIRAELTGHVQTANGPGVGHRSLNHIMASALTAIEDELARMTLWGRRSSPVPDKECFWLLERNTTPPQYVSLNSAGWHHDVWMARRFLTERDAHDYWRLMGETDRPQFKVVEHMFINNPQIHLR